MECVALKLVPWRMSPFQVGFMACVALRLVFTAFCQVCSTACSPKFIFMAFVALFLTPCVTSQVSFMACVALKLVSTAFCQVCFTACSLKFIFMAYVALFFTAFVASQISFMACVALKLVFAAFCTKVCFQGV